MGFGFRRDCSPALDLLTCFLPLTGHTPDSSTLGVWWPMKTSILFSARKAAKLHALAVIWNRASGSLIVLMKPRMESENGLSAQRSRSFIHRTTALGASPRTGAVEMRCWQA